MNTEKPLLGDLQGKDTAKQSITQMLMSITTALLLVTCVGSIVACGSSEADKSAPDIERSDVESRPGLENPQQGQFVDSAVSGLFYKTDTYEGFTDHNGYFNYQPDETVTFYIGNIELGSANASSLITPVELSNGMNDTTINILRLLQTLDIDGDASNGISISGNTHLAASKLENNEVQVTATAEAFETNTALIELIGQTTNVSGLIDADAAIDHFEITQKRLQKTAK